MEDRNEKDIENTKDIEIPFRNSEIYNERSAKSISAENRTYKQRIAAQPFV